MTARVIDLFAGPGGWSEALKRVGLRDVGLEWDAAACKTRAAAGHATIRCDVAAYPVEPFIGRAAGLIASPPCQAWSRAGKRGGIKDQAVVHQLVDELAKGIDNRAQVVAQAQAARKALHDWEAAWRAAADEHGWWEDKEVRIEDAVLDGLSMEAAATPGRVTIKVLSAHGKTERARLFGPRPELFLQDERSILAAEPMRWLHAIRPEWVAMEEVPDVLPLFKQYAMVLREWGYSVWVGILNAADYGVPQTRRRAILIASQGRTVSAPEPTHTRQPIEASLFGDPLPKWASMADTLDLPAGMRINTRGNRRTSGGNEFSCDRPSWALTEKARSWWVLRHSKRSNATVRRTDQPAATLVAGHARHDFHWVLVDGANDLEKRPLTIAEAAQLQGFPSDYPWQGSESRQFLQVANAVPPLLAVHVIAEAAGLPTPGASAEGVAA